jgi:hypothetical protein
VTVPNSRLPLWQAFFLLICNLAYSGLVMAQWVVGGSAFVELSSNSLPVTDLDGRWQAGVSIPNRLSRSFGEKSIEVFSQAPSGWRIAVLQRAQASITATPDTVRLYAQYRSKIDPTSPQNFNIGIESQSWAGTGVSLSSPSIGLLRTDFGDWRLTPTLSVFELQSLTGAAVNGSAGFDGLKTYSFAMHGERYGGSINAPFLGGFVNTGTGASLSLSLAGRVNEKLTASVDVTDAISRLSWKKQKTEILSVNSATETRNVDGTINYGAIINGTSSVSKKSSSAFVKGILNVDYMLDSDLHFATFSASHVAGIYRTWFGYRQQHWQVAVDPISKSLKIGLNALGCGLMLSGDSFAKATQNRSVGAHCNFNF